MIKKIAFIFLVLTCFINLSAQNNNGWENLFNGKNLEGWKQLNGAAKYEVVDGEIIGTTVLNTPNSFLATEKNYSDFIFEVELLVAENMNSGIQFRSLSSPDYMDGRVHGYQCEVDPSERAWSAGIYDEARRGWLYPLSLNPAAQSALKMGQWNKYRIECIGNSIRTWLNDLPVAYVIDNLTPEGFIALQVHSIGDDGTQEGHQIKWRNIRIKTKDLKPAPFDKNIYVVNLLPNDLSVAEKEQGFGLLFDGKSTDKFRSVNSETFPQKGWEVKDGLLSVLSDEGNPENGGGSIITKGQYSAFELKFDFNFSEGANSGIKYFTTPDNPSLGLEYQILDDQVHPDAKQGVDGNRTLASLYDLVPAEKESRFVKPAGEWNRGRIIVFKNGQVEHWLNGRKVVEYNRGDAKYKALVAQSKYTGFDDFGMAEKGYIHIQDHHNLVHFRSLKIKTYDND